MSRVRALLLFTVGCCAVQAAASPNGCTLQELRNPLPPSDPAYRPARHLAEVLKAHGVVIQCIGPSKMADFLPRQLGAALFRTDHGDFEALFRPEEQSFDDIHITGGHARGVPRHAVQAGLGYQYNFVDTEGRLLRRMEGREAFFVMRGNALYVCFDSATAATLKQLLG